MAVEAATYISELVDTNPDGAVAEVSELDNHIRLLKTVLRNQFANFGANQVTASVNELNLLDGATLSTAELNILDGVTAVFGDLNLLAGAAAGGLTAAELMYVNGVTSAIQTQLDGKQPLDADLTSIAALTTAAFGRSLLEGASASAVRTLLGLGALATLGSINNGNWSGTDLSVANGGTGSSNKNDAREALGIYTGLIGSDGSTGNELPSGISASRVSNPGWYRITHNWGHTNYHLLVTAQSSGAIWAAAGSRGANAIDYFIEDDVDARINSPAFFILVDES